MQFDIFSILVATCAAIFVSGLVLLIFWLRDRGASWLVWWAAAYGMLGLGNAAVMAPPAVPQVFSSAGGSALLILGFGLIWQAARVFDHKEPRLLPVATAIAVWLCLYAVPDIEQSLQARIAISSIPFGGGLALAAWELWRSREEGLPSRLWVAGIFAIASLVFFARILAAPYAPYPMGGKPVDALTVTIFNGGLLTLAIMITVLLISMSVERRERGQRSLALTDGLTGLANRRALEERYGDAPLPAETAVVLFDLDFFKAVNDTHGHAAGDEVLVHFTEICREHTRQIDVAARWGGEEFALVLPKSGVTGAKAVAERIRRHFSETVVDYGRGVVACTASAGIALSDGGKDAVLKNLITEADIELYRAKDAGRNRVAMSENHAA